MKILITGGAGLFGQYLNIKLSQKHSILTLYHNNVHNCSGYNSVRADINDSTWIKKIFDDFRPETVIHTAALSSPISASRSDSNYVHKTNTEATGNIASLCAEHNARMIYTSTDLVYAGNRGTMLKEDAELHPVSLYAETKLKGEEILRDTFDNYIILRTALLYGFGMNNAYNHFHQIYINLKNGIPVKLFKDQFRTPIELEDAAGIINQLLNPNVRGETINFGGRERVSRYQLGEKLCYAANFDKNLLEPSVMTDVTDLPPVRDVSMDTSKLQSLGIRQKSIDESIRELLQRF